jgi:hypothetical protein
MKRVIAPGGNALEWGVALAATCIAAWLHFTFRWSAGALWRDEVVSARNAALPSLADIWRHLQCDSFPMLWPVLLRVWASLNPSHGDAWLRTLGLLIGLAILAALWLNARLMGYRIPTMALALLGFNASVICYGDSVRGYGLGVLTGLLAFGLVWSVVEAPRPWRVALALAATLVAVHSVFYNCIVVLAVCAGGAAVCGRNRRWGRAALIVGIGAVGAISMLPYHLTLGSSREWVMTVRYDVGFAWIWAKFRQSNGSTGPFARWFWILACAGCLVAAVRAQRPRLTPWASARQRDVALFCGVALAVGVPCYILFLRVLRYRMNPWYFLALMALMAACVDGGFEAVRDRRVARLCRTGFLALVIALTAHRLWREASLRKTNVDLIAARIERESSPRDLIVLNPWVFGHTFEWYYHGSARWTTLPPIEIPHLEGDYGLLKLTRQMMSRHAVEPVLSAMAETLQSGDRVWWVGRLTIPPPGHEIGEVDPAPDGPLGWDESRYHRYWGLQAGAFVGAHAARHESASVPAGSVNRYEDVSLTVIEGWRP